MTMITKTQFFLLVMCTVFKLSWKRWSVIWILGCLTFQPSFAQQLQVTLSDQEGNPVTDAVVEIILADDSLDEYTTPVSITVDQVNKEFVPLVSPIVVGGEISFPNSDDILHHVYSFSPAKTFDIPLYGSGDEVDYSEVFPDTGVIEIGCNIHDWMLAYIYVAASSLVAVSNEEGVVTLESVPAGEYEVKLWHPRLATGQEDSLGSLRFVEGQSTSVSQTIVLERERRLRRAPSASRRRYR